jgi:predicted ester cyclase
MSADENAREFRRIPEELMNAGNLDLIDALFAPTYVEHARIPPGMPAGREGVRAYFAMILAAFPDIHATVDQLLADGDLTAGHITVQGTHQGEFMGIPSTGKQVTWTETHLGRYDNGQLAEHWGDVDGLAILQQLGVIPDGGPPAD